MPRASRVGFSFETRVPVTAPYRLDLTVDALRRLAANVVDVVSDGAYRRVLADEHAIHVVEVRQAAARELSVSIFGPHPERRVGDVRRMLGTEVSTTDWRRRVRSIPWLAQLSQELRGLHPPRYATLWEAMAQAIVFQQISIHAAAAIMRRLVLALSPPLEYAGSQLYAFPTLATLLHEEDATLRSCGLSANKVAHLRSAAAALASGAVSESALGALSTAQAAQALCGVRGIGPWSAAVVLLRGLGRLDVFPAGDSGVARSIRALSGDPAVDVGDVLKTLGPVRGMLYFHLLLGRLRKAPS